MKICKRDLYKTMACFFIGYLYLNLGFLTLGGSTGQGPETPTLSHTTTWAG